MVTPGSKPASWTVMYPIFEFLRDWSPTGAGLGVATSFGLLRCPNVPFPKLALQRKLLFVDSPICGGFRQSPVADHKLHSMLLYGRLAVPAFNDRSVLLVMVVPDVVDLRVEFGHYLDLGPSACSSMGYP